MKRFRSFAPVTFAVIICLAVTGRKAWGFSGYVDPGTGLLALQCITSVGVATLYFLRRKIRALFGRKDETPVVAAKLASELEVPRDPA